MAKPKISLIAAIGSHNRVLGKGNQLIWYIPDDLKRFKALTNGHPVIMGRKTWESLPEKFRPLPGRLNIVITRNAKYEARGAKVCASLEQACKEVGAVDQELFIIGGGELYKEALPYADRLYMTLIDDAQEGDVFFPSYEQDFTKKIFEEKHEYNGLKYEWVDLERSQA